MYARQKTQAQPARTKYRGTAFCANDQNESIYEGITRKAHRSIQLRWTRRALRAGIFRTEYCGTCGRRGERCHSSRRSRRHRRFLGYPHIFELHARTHPRRAFGSPSWGPLSVARPLTLTKLGMERIQIDIADAPKRTMHLE